jgi:hypothetical protein
MPTVEIAVVILTIYNKIILIEILHQNNYYKNILGNYKELENSVTNSLYML